MYTPLCVSIHKRSHKAIHTYVYAITYLCVKTGKFPTRKTKEGRQKPRMGFLPPLSFILYGYYCLVATLTFSSISQ